MRYLRPPLRTTVAISLVSLFTITTEAPAQLVPSGEQAELAGPQSRFIGRSFGALPNGVFVEVRETPGVEEDVVAQRYDSAGSVIGTEFQINTYTTGRQVISRGAVASTPGGGFVVTWEDFGGGAPGVHARLYDASGIALSGDILVTSPGPTAAAASAVAVAASGEFVIAWGEDDSVVARRYDNLGNAVGTEFTAMTFAPVEGQGGPSPAIATSEDGNFVIVEQTDDGSYTGIEARVFDASGTPAGPQFRVNAVTSGRQFSAAVSMATDGAFLVAWSSAGPVPGTTDVLATAYDSTGTALGTEFQIPSYTTHSQSSPEIAALDDGAFAVVWRDSRGFGQCTFDAAATVNTFTLGGAPLGDPLRADTEKPGVVDGPGCNGWIGPVDILASTETGKIHVFFENTDHFLLRSFCDASNPGCDRCPGFDDSVDDDGDGVPAGCDPCTNVGGAQSISVKPKLTVANDDSASIATKKNKVRAQGEFTLPGPAGAFAAIDPVARGARVLVESADGHAILDVRVPPGAFADSGTAGWRVNGSGSTFKFRDKSGAAPRGLSQLIIQDRSSKTPNQIRVKARAQAANYPTHESLLPLSMRFVLGDQTDADAGRCGEFTFQTPSCEIRNRVLMRCK